MRTLTTIVTLLTALLCVGCSQQPTAKITTTYDKSTNLSQYHTFEVVEADSTKVAETSLNPSVFSQAEASIKKNLATRGLKETLSKPDLQVIYAIHLKDKMELYTVQKPQYVHSNLSPQLLGHIESIHIFKYIEGTLIIKLMDTNSQQIIWEGRAVGAIPDKKAENSALLRTTITKIFEQYPSS